MAKYIKKFDSNSAIDTHISSALYEDPAVYYSTNESSLYYNIFGNQEYVNLALPSGTLWATCNVGASSPDEYGYYLSWGELEDKNTNRYTWSNYKFTGTPTKYNSTDGLTVLEPADDAANYHMGGGWHIPTKEQIQELLDNTTQTNSTYNSVAGRYFTSNINGNKIFIPFAGGKWYDNDGGYGTNLYIWSSSLRTNSKTFAYCTSNSNGSTILTNSFTRRDGLSVRGVLNKIKLTDFIETEQLR